MFTAWPRFMHFLYLSYSLSQHWPLDPPTPESIKEWGKVVWDMTISQGHNYMDYDGKWNIQ